MRYSPAVVTLVVATIAFGGAVVLLVGALGHGRTGSAVLLAVVLGLASLVAGAWATGRIRRIRSITPEAIIRSPDEVDGSAS